MQTFFGSVKKSAFAKATARQAPRFFPCVFLSSDTDILCLCKKMECLHAAFAADTTLFHAAERNAQVADQPAIYPDCAGVDSLGDAMGATQILCPDARRQAVVAVVGVIDDFFFAVEGRDCYDWAKDFFA